MTPVIVRSARRTLSLRIERDGTLTIRAPMRASETSIRRLLDTHREWIRRTVDKMRRRSEEVPVRTFLAGERFPVLGRSCPLTVVPGAGTTLRFDEVHGFILAERCLPRARALFEDWYRREARRVFISRAAEYGARMGLRHVRLTVRNAETRWGSCGPDGGLSFNWKLVMAPLPILDYVVVHELAHLAQRNHSKRFWALVAAHCQGWREARSWLHRHGHTLTL